MFTVHGGIWSFIFLLVSVLCQGSLLASITSYKGTICCAYNFIFQLHISSFFKSATVPQTIRPPWRCEYIFLRDLELIQMCEYVCVCAHAHMCIVCAYLSMCQCMCVAMFMYLCMHVCLCVYACVSVCACVCVSQCMYMWICMCMHMCLCHVCMCVCVFYRLEEIKDLKICSYISETVIYIYIGFFST